MRIPIKRREPRSKIDAALRTATSLMPHDGDIGAFVKAISTSRDRPIHVLEVAVPTDSPSGGWFACVEADYVVVDAASTLSRRAAIVCHELAHILLGHQGEPLTNVQLGLLAPSLNPSVAARFLGRHGYDSEVEHEAELLGTKLAAAAERARFDSGDSQDRVSRRVR